MRDLLMAVLVGALIGAGLVYGVDRGGTALSASSRGTYSTFAGTWQRHGSAFTITPDGAGTESHRTYINCKSPEQSACDYFGGQYIYDGGYLRFHLTRTTNGKAYGAISESSASWEVGVPVTLAFTKKGILTLFYANLSESGCGKDAPLGACGA